MFKRLRPHGSKVYGSLWARRRAYGTKRLNKQKIGFAGFNYRLMKTYLTVVSTVLLTWMLLGIGAMNHGFATDLPPGLLAYLKQKDPKVQVRFDGVIQFSNQDTYVPVLPQIPGEAADPKSVVMQDPPKTASPDLIQFDNNLFLLKLIPTASGRYTLLRRDTYPIALKEGLLPQDLVIPETLSIPAELKVILGALPYEAPKGDGQQPQTPLATPDLTWKPVEASKTVGNPKGFTPLTSPSAVDVSPGEAFIADITHQRILAMNPLTGKPAWSLELNCLPSSLTLSSDNAFLFVTCLSSNELVVVDVAANLIKTRIPVGSRPSNSVILPDSQEILVSNRFSQFLSLIRLQELVKGLEIELPGYGGAMVYAPSRNSVFVADANEGKVYELSLTTHKVLRTLTTLPDISEMLWLPTPEGETLWVASRSQHQVQVLNGETGAALATLTVGEKPSSLAFDGQNTVYVLASNDDRIEMIDAAKREVQKPILLEAGSFPLTLRLLPGGQTALVTAAASDSLSVVDLSSGIVQKTLPLKFKTNALTVSGGSAVGATLVPLPTQAVVQGR